MATVLNHDIAGLHSRVNRFIEEVYKSVSSSSSQFNGFDQERVGTYLDAVDTYREWVIAQPQMDLPETHPTEYELGADPAIESVENESVNDLIRLFTVLRGELINSQSARNAAGLISFDNTRLVAVIAKARAFMESYVEPVTPLDLPESSPAKSTSGKGKTGI